MLLFNYIQGIKINSIQEDFNTSNVTIQQQQKDIKTTKKIYFNTSNVTIQPMVNTGASYTQMDFNTSNVTIQRRLTLIQILD